MTVIKNVAFIGATGNVGSTLVRALDASGKFNIKVLTRQRTQKHDGLPPSLLQNLHTVDFTSHSALVSAFTGIDAVVLSISFPNPLAADIEIPIIRAAIEAGVKLFIPSEWAPDTTKHVLPTNRVLAPKRSTHQYLFSKSDQIGYAMMYTGTFPEVHVKLGLPYYGSLGHLGIDIANKHANLPDGGIHPFSATTFATAASALIAVLTSYPRSHNRILHFSDGVLTPLEVLAMVEKITDSKFTLESYNLIEMSAFAEKEIAEGQNGIALQLAMLRLPFMAGGEISMFPKVDNDEFGVERRDVKAATEDAIRGALNGQRMEK